LSIQASPALCTTAFQTWRVGGAWCGKLARSAKTPPHNGKRFWHTPRVRAQGWALSEQQLELGARGIAVARVLPVLQETARAMRNLI